MVDPSDNQAYLAYDAWGNDHAIVIEKLTADYTDTLGVQGRYSTHCIFVQLDGHISFMIFILWSKIKPSSVNPERLN